MYHGKSFGFPVLSLVFQTLARFQLMTLGLSHIILTHSLITVQENHRSQI